MWRLDSHDGGGTEIPADQLSNLFDMVGRCIWLMRFLKISMRYECFFAPSWYLLMTACPTTFNFSNPQTF